MPQGIFVRKPRPLQYRFDKHVEMVPESGCWIWTGPQNSHGYGMISIAKKVYSAHRVSWELYNGKIPKEMCVLHRCDTPSCVNPNHLFLGSQKDNMHDCLNKGRFVFNHKKGEQHGNSKLTENDVVEIRQSSLSRSALAKQYNVTPSMIRYIITRHSWRHVK